MLINDKSLMIQYETLKDEEKDILRESCIRFIKNEESITEYCLNLLLCQGCNCTIKSREIPSSFIKLIDYINNDTILDNNDTILDNNDDDTLLKALSLDIEIPYNEIDQGKLNSAFINYLKKYLNPFMEEELMIILIILYTKEEGTFLNKGNILRRSDFIKRIPFIISQEYRELFIKLRRLSNNYGKYIIKSRIEVEDVIKENIMKDIMETEYYEFPEEFFKQ